MKVKMFEEDQIVHHKVHGSGQIYRLSACARTGKQICFVVFDCGEEGGFLAEDLVDYDRRMRSVTAVRKPRTGPKVKQARLVF